jgi:Ca2+-binding RTX toxin-like protein
MKGDVGNDVMSGGTENDTMLGGDGTDEVNGDGGDDRLDGNMGRDTVDGGAGNDLVAGGGSDDTLAGGTGADTFLFRQDDVGSPPDTDVILDWDADDVIALCGQAAGFFSVQKIEIGFFDGFDNLVKDVVIGLSNGQFILIVDAGDSGDWVADDVDPEAANAGNFIRFAPGAEECKIECDVEWPA